MEPSTSLEDRAEERVMERNGFYLHLGFYLVTSVALVAVNLFLGGNIWFYVPVMGWAAAIFLHGAITFIGQTRWMEARRSKQVGSEIEKLRRYRP